MSDFIKLTIAAGSIIGVLAFLVVAAATGIDLIGWG